jgi:hypothetical protein
MAQKSINTSIGVISMNLLYGGHHIIMHPITFLLEFCLKFDIKHFLSLSKEVKFLIEYEFASSNIEFICLFCKKILKK